MNCVLGRLEWKIKMLLALIGRMSNTCLLWYNKHVDYNKIMANIL